jgi:hypothetical protein
MAADQLFADPFGDGSASRGRGRSGRGAGPGGAGAPSRSEQSDAGDITQKLLDEVTALVRYPPPALTIAQTPTAITFTDAQGKNRTLQTNGRREKLPLESGTVEIAARWEGTQLVSDHDLGRGRKMTVSYSIVPTTGQLLVRVSFERSPGQPGPFQIKQVYNRDRL